LPALSVGGPVIVDADNTGDAAVVITTTDGKLWALKSDLSGARTGFPVNGTGTAKSGAFTFVGADNFPRIGFLQADSNKVAIHFTFGSADAAATFKTNYTLRSALPVSGSRMEGLSLPDGDHLYIFGAAGESTRLDPDVATGSFSVVNLAPLGMP